MKLEDLKEGTLYVISDAFFKKANDPYLMKNHGPGFRPTCFVFIDQANGIPWMVPFTTKIIKFDSLTSDIYKAISRTTKQDEIEKLKKKLLGYKKCVVNGIDCYMLFSNMFPINAKYIRRPYMVQGIPYALDSTLVKEIKGQASEVLKLLKEGFKFRRTQPDIMKIEQIMLDEKK